MTTSRSKAQPKKKPIPSNIKKRCLTVFQRMRRLEEANTDGLERCITCGKLMHWKNSQEVIISPALLKPLALSQTTYGHSVRVVTVTSQAT